MVHFSQLLSTAVLVSVSSAVPMVRRYAPSATMNTYNSYQTGTYQASSNMDSSYGSGYDSSYGTVDSSYASSDSSYASSDSSYASSDSSYASSDSSYGSSDSSYGSSDSSYGGSDSSYGNSWNSMSADTLLNTATSTSSYYATQTTSALYTQATYGSGSSSWSSSSSSSGYDSCVQQCSAQFGAPPSSTTTPPSEEVSGSSTDSSSAATHTILVAPSAGALKYLPFATNANPGDKIVFQWMAGTHTVTQSSAAEVCNKTANGFASGMRTAPSIFNQVINNTEPIWFYCGVPGHCEQGMFGGINIGNPQQVSGSNSSTYMPMSSVLNDMAQDSDVSTAWNYTMSVVGANSSLSTWGMDINCAGMNNQNQKLALLNVLYTQSVMALNPTVFQNGSIVGPTTSLSLPQDFAAQTNATNNGTSSASDSSSPKTNGVESLLAPRSFMAFVAVLASLALF